MRVSETFESFGDFLEFCRLFRVSKTFKSFGDFWQFRRLFPFLESFERVMRVSESVRESTKLSKASETLKSL